MFPVWMVLFQDKSGSFMQFTDDNCNLLVGKPITGRFLVRHPLNTQFHPVTASNHLLVGEITFFPSDWRLPG